MGNNDDEAGTSDTSKVSQKKARGENIDKVYHHPPSGEFFTVKWSFDCQPIGRTGALFNKKIGVLARRNELFPIDIKWVEQSKDKLEFAISELQEISKLNKINRAKQMTQHVGAKGLASRSHELMERGMSQGDSWMSTVGTCYPQEEKIANTINFVKCRKGKELMETEKFSEMEL